MHLSMHNWMRGEPIEQTAKRLAKYGFESLEIIGEPELYDTREVRDTLKEYGIRCWGAVTWMVDNRDLLARDQGQREESVEYVKTCLTMVKELEGNVLTIVPTKQVKLIPEGTPEEEWEWAVNSLRECYSHGLKEGVRIAIEAIHRFETYFCMRAEQALRLAEAVGENCGVCLDTFHLNIEEADPFAAIISAKGRLFDFHVAGSNRMACGQGHFDWPKIISTLKSIGYDGALTLEFDPPIDRTPVNPFPNAIEIDELRMSPEQKWFLEKYGLNPLTEEFYDWLVEKSSKTLLPLIK